MKVQGVTQRSPDALPGIEKEGRQGGLDIKATAFGDELCRAQTSQVQQRLESLLQEITRQGKKLSQYPTWDELRNYKEMIRKFVGEVVHRLYNLRHETGWDRKGRQKMFTIVQSVDRELEELTSMILGQQSDQLKIVAKIDIIQGMLLDLYA